MWFKNYWWGWTQFIPKVGAATSLMVALFRTINKIVRKFCIARLLMVIRHTCALFDTHYFIWKAF